MEKNVVKKEYSLFSAIAMIVGIVIGSGIFFKSDDVLVYTGGSVMLGVLVFIVAAISIIFGSLTIAQLAIRTNKPGGVITYMEETWSSALSGSFGWFHTLVYYPTLIVIVSWVSGVYINSLFGFNQTLISQCLIGLIAMSILFLVNIFSKKIGDLLQISSTVIKLIPLFLIAILGLVKGNPVNITSDAVVVGTTSMGFIAAIVPIAFSFDGWICSTSISHEIKDAKRKLPLALIVSPIFIVIIYSMYLMGISALVGPEQIIALGDEHVNVAANMLFGSSGAKIILTFVVISVLGTVNGLILGGMRLPYSLANRNMFPNSKKVSLISEKLDVPIFSSIIMFIVCLIWYIVHYLVFEYSLLQGSDISEIAIVMNYVCYIALYFGVIKLFKKGEIKSKISGLFNPIMATIGSLIIFTGSILVVGADSISFNVKPLIFMGVSCIIIICSYIYCKKQGE